MQCSVVLSYNFCNTAITSRQVRAQLVPVQQEPVRAPECQEPVRAPECQEPQLLFSRALRVSFPVQMDIPLIQASLPPTSA